MNNKLRARMQLLRPAGTAPAGRPELYAAADRQSDSDGRRPSLIEMRRRPGRARGSLVDRSLSFLLLVVGLDWMEARV